VRTQTPNSDEIETRFKLPPCDAAIVVAVIQAESAQSAVGKALPLRMTVAASQSVRFTYKIEHNPDCWFVAGICAGRGEASPDAAFETEFQALPVRHGDIALPAPAFTFDGDRPLVHVVRAPQSFVSVHASGSASRTYVLAPSAAAS
jgi:hypothetical protein